MDTYHFYIFYLLLLPVDLEMTKQTHHSALLVLFSLQIIIIFLFNFPAFDFISWKQKLELLISEPVVSDGVLWTLVLLCIGGFIVLAVM